MSSILPPGNCGIHGYHGRTTCACPCDEAANVIDGLLRRLYELNADDHPAEEAARAWLAEHGSAAREHDVLDGLPPDLVRVLRDPSIIVAKDAVVFELVAKWMDAPSNTASAMTVEDWRAAWIIARREIDSLRARVAELEAELGR